MNISREKSLQKWAEKRHSNNKWAKRSSFLQNDQSIVNASLKITLPVSEKFGVGLTPPWPQKMGVLTFGNPAHT